MKIYMETSETRKENIFCANSYVVVALYINIYIYIYQARWNEIDIGGAVKKQTALGSGRIFVRPRPLDCWKATWLYKLPLSMDELLFTELRKFLKWKL